MQTVEQIRAAYDASGGSDLQVEGKFAIINCTVKEGKSGAFATVELRDGSGSLTARCFDGGSIEKLMAGGAVIARLRVSPFNNAMSAIINSFKSVELDDIELLELAGLDRDAHEKRIEEVQGYLAACEGTVYGDVLTSAFADGVWEKFLMAPAAVKMHHAEPGGLLRHICEVARGGLALLDSTGSPYDRAFFLAGVFLHDLGKIDTYTTPPTIAYTAQGQLAEHQIWSTFRLAKACGAVGVPASIETKLVHIIEQAHGAFRHAEWQDPLGLEVKALATADFFSSRLGVTEKERRAQDALDDLFAQDSHVQSSRDLNSLKDAVEPEMPSEPNLFT